MKRKIALLLALVMVLSMVPMMSFAASTNSVDKVPTVKDDFEFDVDGAPRLRIEEKNLREFGSDAFQFRLNLTNAEWTDDVETVTALVYSGTTVIGTATIEKRTDTSATVKVSDLAARNGSNKAYVEIPLVTELQGNGEAKVTIDALNSAVSAGTFTFAIGAGGATVATVGSAKTLERGINQEGANIIIDETIPGAIDGAQKIRVRLPKDFKWQEADTDVVLENITNSGLVTDVTNDGRDLIIEFTADGSGSTVRGSIIIKPVIEVTKDADHGEVAVSINNLRGDITSETGLVIGNYKDYGVKISIEEVKEFYAGRLDEDYVTAEIEIKETIANSLFPGRTIDFELPEWVSLREDFTIANDKAADTPISVDADLDDRTFSYTVPTGVSAKQTITFELPLTIEGTATGDVVLNIKGAGIEETDLVVAKAVAPVTVEVAKQEAPFEIGKQRQSAPDIIIKEAYAGAIRDLSSRNLLVVSVMDQFADSMRFDDAEFKVVEGDIEIDKLTVNDGDLTLKIKAQSEKASTIKLTDIKMTLDRTVPQGTFRLNIGGNALVDNRTPENDFANRVARFDYIEVGTPIPGGARTQVSLTIGVVPEGGDVAPYVKNNRTFAPVSAVAQALGVAKSNIIWNEEARTVTILGNKTVQMTIGSTTLLVNGTPVVMDVAPEITNSRTFLPISWLAKALDVNYTWDAATQTVTFY